ncbi:MAG TPA: cupin domain-containing protein [Gemmatimonadaceae bacterium]|nr:cupin domain-containing protein [Gemmatimonadaceae bacterium]
MSARIRGTRALLLFAIAGACSDAKEPGVSSSSASALAPTSPALVTVPAVSTSTPLGRATFTDPKDPVLMVKRITGDFHVEVKAKPALDVAMQSISFPAGAQSTWHKHPGPVFIIVAEGTMTFYESDDPTCTPEVKTKGQGFLDKGEHAHMARNESGAPAQTVVTYLVPQGAALRIDQPRPGNCPF